MQVGEVLDFWDRDQASEPGTQPKTENCLLIEQCVEDSSRSMFPRKTCRDAIDPTLDTNVLPEDDHSAVRSEHVVQRGVDRLSEGTRPGPVRRLSFRLPVEQRRPSGTQRMSGLCYLGGARGASGAMTSAAELSFASDASRSASWSICRRMAL